MVVCSASGSPNPPVLHQLVADVRPPERFTWPFHYVPHPLCRLAAEQVEGHIAAHEALAAALGQGKMLGVLVVRHPAGGLGFLAACSGVTPGVEGGEWFVPPVCDLSDPDGEYRREERAITDINRRIAALEADPERTRLAAERDALADRQQRELAQARAEAEQARQRRHEQRQCGTLNAEQERQLVAQSQHSKASLRRMRARHRDALAAANAALAACEQPLEALRHERRSRSEALQRRLFDLYVLHNALGQTCTVAQAFEAYALATRLPHLATPPGGAGECCAPKLLQSAYLNALQPLCMAEFWHGHSPEAQVRHHGHFYPACRSKCLPILTFMLQGLDVEPNPLESQACDEIREVYDDHWLTVIVKPAGMLSVPGRLPVTSALERFTRRHPEATGPLVVHRLDQETSGLMVIAKDKDTHAALQRQFAGRTVSKRYIALLNGRVTADSGIIDLPLRPDPYDRPRQVVDRRAGRAALTAYRVLECRSDGTTLVEFEPSTGRTHQLRVHASHTDGLCAPIVGDMLYGTADRRLMLHAARLTFRHPATGAEMTFESECPF